MKLEEFLKLLENRITKSLLVFVGMLSMLVSGFAMGRVSDIKSEKPEVRVVDVRSVLELSTSSQDISEENNFENSNNSNQNNYNQNNFVTKAGSAKNVVNKGVIFGSSKGKYFYYKGCGGTTISPKNLVYYKSEADALAKGKVLYSRCK